MKQIVLWSRIPKTGSTSLHEKIVGGRSEKFVKGSELTFVETKNSIVFMCGHRTPKQIVESGFLEQHTIDNIEILSVVRNPWARWVSMFVGVGNDYKFTNSFPRFVSRCMSDPELRISLEGTTPSLKIQDWAEQATIVGKLESKIDQFRILNRLSLKGPLSVMNAHEHKPYPEYYDKDTIRMVEDHDSWAIETFRYKFGEDL